MLCRSDKILFFVKGFGHYPRYLIILPLCWSGVALADRIGGDGDLYAVSHFSFLFTISLNFCNKFFAHIFVFCNYTIAYSSEASKK
jgi:hypothetical protein